jgi:hypothetical protein
LIVVGAENLTALQSQPANKDKTPAELEKTLRDRLYRWIYAEAQPKSRLIVMFEREVVAWASKLEKLASSGELPNTAFGAKTPVVITTGLPLSHRKGVSRLLCAYFLGGELPRRLKCI